MFQLYDGAANSSQLRSSGKVLAGSWAPLPDPLLRDENPAFSQRILIAEEAQLN